MLSKCKLNRFFMFLFLLGLVTMSGCSDIRLQPKDPELIALGKFADQVTEHLLDMNPVTYHGYQAALAEELSPGALNQLQIHGQCAKSLDESTETARKIEQTSQRCIIQIDSTTFPGKTTKDGLVPIEVKGNCIKSQNYISKASKFDVLYLVGTNTKTKRPIVASVDIKEF